MPYIYTDALYSTPGSNGFYSLSSDNAEVVATNNNSFTAAYNVCGNGYNQDSFTVNGTTVKATVPYTFTVYKYNNGVACTPNASTFTLTVSSTAAIPMALLLNPGVAPFDGGGNHHATLAVPYNIPANSNSLTTTSVDVDLSAATVSFSDPEKRRLLTLGYL